MPGRGDHITACLDTVDALPTFSEILLDPGDTLTKSWTRRSRIEGLNGLARYLDANLKRGFIRCRGRAATGVLTAFAMLGMNARRLATGVKAGWTVTAIGAHIGRHKSVISRELSRNSTKTRGYRVVHADCLAERRRARPQPRKVARDPLLAARVRADLKQGRSPRAIAGRLRAEHDDPGLPAPTGSPAGHGCLVSHEAIYAYIYALPKGELARHGIMLESRRTRRRAGKPAHPK